MSHDKSTSTRTCSHTLVQLGQPSGLEGRPLVISKLQGGGGGVERGRGWGSNGEGRGRKGEGRKGGAIRTIDVSGWVCT